MGLSDWFECISPGDFELLLHIARIVIPVTSLLLWQVSSSYIDIFDRMTGAVTAVVSGILAVWCYVTQDKPTVDDDDSETKFYVTSKVDCPRGEKISKKWLVTWKRVPEGECSAARVSDESSNDYTRTIYFDPNTGISFNINTSIQPMGVQELNDESIPKEVDGSKNRPPGETDKTR